MAICHHIRGGSNNALYGVIVSVLLVGLMTMEVSGVNDVRCSVAYDKMEAVRSIYVMMIASEKSNKGINKNPMDKKRNIASMDHCDANDWVSLGILESGFGNGKSDFFRPHWISGQKTKGMYGCTIVFQNLSNILALLRLSTYLPFIVWPKFIEKSKTDTKNSNILSQNMDHTFSSVIWVVIFSAFLSLKLRKINTSKRNVNLFNIVCFIVLFVQLNCKVTIAGSVLPAYVANNITEISEADTKTWEVNYAAICLDPYLGTMLALLLDKSRNVNKIFFVCGHANYLEKIVSRHEYLKEYELIPNEFVKNTLKESHLSFIAGLSLKYKKSGDKKFLTNIKVFSIAWPHAGENVKYKFGESSLNEGGGEGDWEPEIWCHRGFSVCAFRHKESEEKVITRLEVVCCHMADLHFCVSKVGWEQIGEFHNDAAATISKSQEMIVSENSKNFTSDITSSETTKIDEEKNRVEAGVEAGAAGCKASLKVEVERNKKTTQVDSNTKTNTKEESKSKTSTQKIEFSIPPYKSTYIQQGKGTCGGFILNSEYYKIDEDLSPKGAIIVGVTCALAGLIIGAVLFYCFYWKKRGNGN